MPGRHSSSASESIVLNERSSRPSRISTRRPIATTPRTVANSACSPGSTAPSGVSQMLSRSHSPRAWRRLERRADVASLLASRASHVGNRQRSSHPRRSTPRSRPRCCVPAPRTAPHEHARQLQAMMFPSIRTIHMSQRFRGPCQQRTPRVIRATSSGWSRRA